MYYGNFSVLNNLNVAYATCDNLGCHCVVEANGVPNVQLTVETRLFNLIFVPLCPEITNILPKRPNLKICNDKSLYGLSLPIVRREFDS